MAIAVFRISPSSTSNLEPRTNNNPSLWSRVMASSSTARAVDGRAATLGARPFAQSSETASRQRLPTTEGWQPIEPTVSMNIAWANRIIRNITCREARSTWQQTGQVVSCLNHGRAPKQSGWLGNYRVAGISSASIGRFLCAIARPRPNRSRSRATHRPRSSIVAVEPAPFRSSSKTRRAR